MAGKKHERPTCPFDHPDCFALLVNDHRCWCLDDTEFKKGRDCPFYKPEIEVSHELIVKKYLED